MAAVETIRIESGLLFIGRDYFQHETSPYDVGLDKLIRLDKPEFCGKDALAAEAASPPNRFVTLVVDGAVPEYGAAVTKDGERVGTLTSPCESPTLGKVIGLTVLRTDLARDGEQRRGRRRGRDRPRDGRPDAPVRHREEPPASVAVPSPSPEERDSDPDADGMLTAAEPTTSKERGHRHA